jgi:23S rRNA (cytidine1920-2'-O)/16S rRNA (cytidine1409-2'-O)-methyltransferase
VRRGVYAPRTLPKARIFLGQAPSHVRNAARVRLDQALVSRGLVATRSRAQDLIRRGMVSIGGAVATEAGQLVDLQEALAIAPGHVGYVSRGAEKLAAALEAFGFDAAERVALDIGASTGGFTQVLLARGVARVYAVDVGRDQLHDEVRGDARVRVHEATDARALTREIVPEAVNAVVADVSFISLMKALPAALALAEPGAWLIALVKPQFEAGREAIGKGGIVRDPTVHARVLDEVQAWFRAQAGWRVVGLCPSPVLGGDGNREFLIGAVLHE